MFSRCTALGAVLFIASCNAFDAVSERNVTSEFAPQPLPSKTAEDTTTLGPGLACGTRVDRDGDGLTAFDVTNCTSEQLLSFQPKAGDDCDDENSSRGAVSRFFRDADGDGFGTAEGQVVWACPDQALLGMAGNDKDCNDEDAIQQLLLHRDRDADGQGAGAGACLRANTTGFSTSGTDCDDADPNVYLWAPGEVPLDGVDTDCNGSEVPAVATSGLELAWGEPPRCTGGVLAVIAIEIANRRGFYVHVANVGDTLVDSAMLVLEPVTLGPLEATRMPIVGPLSPGRAARSEFIENGTYDASFTYPATPIISDGGVPMGPSSSPTFATAEAPGAEAGLDAEGILSEGQPSSGATDAGAETSNTDRCSLAKAPSRVSVITRGDPL